MEFIRTKKSFITAVVVSVIVSVPLFILHIISPTYLSQQKDLDLTALTGEPDQSANYVFDNVGYLLPSQKMALTQPRRQVLGQSNLNKRIEIDLSAQRLYAYEGDKQIFNFLVSTGKWGKTPVGTFKIWVKLRYTKMEGGSKAINTYYYLPNVPYTMFFYNADIPKYRGYGIHGTYWHSNFGHPMSHGCINMKTEEVALLYDWATPVVPEGKQSVWASDDNEGTTVIIYGTAPAS